MQQGVRHESRRLDFAITKQRISQLNRFTGRLTSRNPNFIDLLLFVCLFLDTKSKVAIIYYVDNI